MTEFQTRPSLIARVRNRADSESWSEFYQFYQPLLMRYLRSLGFKEHDANDVIQDVFIRLLQSLPSFELDSRRGRFRTYLWKLTYSALVDGARRIKIRRRAEEEWVNRFLVADESESRKLHRELEEINHQQILEKALPRVQVVHIINNLELFRAASAPRPARLGHRRRTGNPDWQRLRLRIACPEKGQKAMRPTF